MTSALVERVWAARQLPSRLRAREIREAAGVTQREVAGELGVHPLTVTRWEAGTRTPSGDRRAAYAKLLDEFARAVSS